MITLALVLAVVAVLYAVAHGWPGSRWLRRFWSRRGPGVRAWIANAPLTYGYLCLLTFTTWLLSNANGRLRAAFLAEQSTSLREMTRTPVEVLIRSALYVSPLELLAWWLAFSLVVARIEHRVGSQRVLACFAIGHVGASVLVAALTAWAITAGTLGQSAARGIDVGASYGFAALAAMATWLLPARWRAWWAVAVLVVVATGLAVSPDATAVGHALAALLGFACYPLVRPAVLDRRRRSRPSALSAPR